MALGWDAAWIRQIEKGQVQAGVFFRLATAPVVRLWAGVGPTVLPDDLVETTDQAEYRGTGELLDLPEISQLINGVAERVNFSITGTAVTGEVAAIASTEAADVRAAVVNIGFCALDEDAQQLSDVAWLWEGEADSLIVDRSPDGETGIARKVSLSVGSVMTGRRRPSPSYFTDPDQRSRSADDRFCDTVKRYEPGTTKVWPE